MDLSTDVAGGISQVSQEQSTKQDGDWLSEVQGSCLHRMSTRLRKGQRYPTDASSRCLPVQGCGCLSLTCAGIGDLAVIMCVALHRTGSRCGPGEGVLTVLHSTDEQRPRVLGQAERTHFRIIDMSRGYPPQAKKVLEGLYEVSTGQENQR